MEKQKELLIGFDARDMSSTYKKNWDTQKMNSYLIKTDLIKPLSTDLMVWNSVSHLINLNLPSWVGPVQELWDDLERMRIFLRSYVETNTVNYWVIGITKFVEPSLLIEMKNDYQIVPSEVLPHWALLGFDVSDQYLLSSLTDVTQTSKLKTEWAAKLNQYHLFGNIEHAFEFVQLSNERIREHSPFYVYGIYVIDIVPVSS